MQISEVFSEIAEEPAGAASLAQVYRAALRDTGDVVAVKIQRPGLLPIITRDLYVMKKAVEVRYLLDVYSIL
jgi:aarF domain-containing kinase